MNFSNKLIIMLLLLTCSINNTFSQQKPNPEKGVSKDKKTFQYTTQDKMPSKYAIVLYSNQAAKNGGNSQKMAAHWANKGNSSFSWQKDISEAGIYEVAISYSAKNTGSLLSISTGNDSIAAGLAVTAGYYPATSTDWFAFNCERMQVPGKLYLKKGMNTVTVKFTGDNEVNLYSIELIPAFKNILVSKDIARAKKMKPDMEWFTQSPYGVMFHWTSQSAPQNGPLKSYKEAVDAFDVSAFVKMVRKTGAAYVIFTTNHAEPYFPAPLKNWEKEYPGHTASRDLVEELADSLQRHNIKLILYLATHIYAKYDQVNDAEFERLNFSLLSEIGERYKTKVAGYWLDGWYQSHEKHPSFDFEKLYQVCKTGNRDRLLCLNSWVYPVETLWQDYWAGEVYNIGNPATAKTLENGPGKGLQAQSLIVMETDDWLHTTLNTKIKSPDLKADDLATFISKQKGKGPVTVNIQIYQDGHISDEALNVMETVSKKIKK